MMSIGKRDGKNTIVVYFRLKNIKIVRGNSYGFC